jgi:hypothetical protein
MIAERRLMKARFVRGIRRGVPASLCVAVATFLAVFLSGSGPGGTCKGVEGAVSARFRDEIQPLLVEFCYGCHGDGMRKGQVAFDGFASEDALIQNRDLWWSVLKNVRSNIMPPPKKPRPSADQVKLLEGWIKHGVFGIDPNDPDPGRVTIRRLNRVEYRNTVRDLTGIDYRTDEEFPPDDTGYGFDNIGDVLTVSPLLLEKYMEAAESVVAAAVPAVSRVVRSHSITGSEFLSPEGKPGGDRMSFYKPATVAHTVRADHKGTYHLTVNLIVRGAFNFDPGRCRLVMKAGDRELLRDEFKWEDGRRHRFEFTETWEAGEHPVTFQLEPLTPPEKKKTFVDMSIGSVLVEGPLEREHWVRPPSFELFFTRDDPGPGPERRVYARDVLRRFATKAYRRPVDDRNLERLVAIAEQVYGQPGKSVEQGVAQAMAAVLSSPRFLFRVEDVIPGDGGHPLVDEYALASRLSYFLWSTMPDEELFRLAGRGELRKNLADQVKRLLADPRSERLVRNFTGQWLQARDVEGLPFDARTILARDSGEEKELNKEMEEFRAFLAQREAQAKANPAPEKGQPPQGSLRLSGRFQRIFGKPKVELDGPLRDAMRRETEMVFAEIVQEDRSVLELLDSDHTFLNERLAKHYGIPDVTGVEMRRVSLPKDSPRGGLLTQGTVLVVTSNPTRTSPVKRGLFILDNILGTPPPPPPATVAQLEESEKGFKDREPTLREVLELHRSKPLCNSCHSRMDPLGLALENFNAMGMWREKERNQPFDTAGKLITGEPFADVRELKRLLKEQRRGDFYRCLTEKLLTYALGRGLDASDVETVDRIVDRLEQENGRFSALLLGVIESAPVQKRRRGPVVTAAAAGLTPPRDSRTSLP